MDGYTALDKLDQLPDDELLVIVNRRLSLTSENRLHDLGSEEKRGILSTEESHELDQLLEQVNLDMLLRSKALLLLKERGRDITSYLKI